MILKNIIFFTITSCFLYSDELHQIHKGETYKVLEKDLIEMIQEHITENKDMIEQKLNDFQSQTKNKMMNLKNDFNLPFVTENEEVKDNLAYMITQKDLAPKNVPLVTIVYPLKYTVLPYQIYLINGGEEKEIEWLKKQDYKNIQARVWIVNGRLKDLTDDLGIPVYFYSEKIHNRFKAKGTPAIIKQTGEEMVFNYFKIER